MAGRGAEVIDLSTPPEEGRGVAVTGSRKRKRTQRDSGDVRSAGVQVLDLTDSPAEDSRVPASAKSSRHRGARLGGREGGSGAWGGGRTSQQGQVAFDGASGGALAADAQGGGATSAEGAAGGHSIEDDEAMAKRLQRELDEEAQREREAAASARRAMLEAYEEGIEEVEDDEDLQELGEDDRGEGPGGAHRRLRGPRGQVDAQHYLHMLGLQQFLGVIQQGGNAHGLMSLAMSDRDFTEEDYEALLHLDEGAVKRGLSATMLSRIPTSIVTESTLPKEPCSICLDECVKGNCVRHLPCLHTFHDRCIERWFETATTCPVCKHDVRGSA